MQAAKILPSPSQLMPPIDEPLLPQKNSFHLTLPLPSRLKMKPLVRLLMTEEFSAGSARLPVKSPSSEVVLPLTAKPSGEAETPLNRL